MDKEMEMEMEMDLDNWNHLECISYQIQTPNESIERR